MNYSRAFGATHQAQGGAPQMAAPGQVMPGQAAPQGPPSGPPPRSQAPVYGGVPTLPNLGEGNPWQRTINWSMGYGPTGYNPQQSEILKALLGQGY